MIIFDERLSEILDETNARRGWFLNLRVQQTNEYAHVEQMIDALEMPSVAA